MKITHYLHDLAVFPLSFSFRPAADRVAPESSFSLLRGPIVFTPGMGCHRNWFDSAFRHPALSNHTLLAVDLPGQGDSPDSPLSRNHRHGFMTTLSECVQGAVEMVADFDSNEVVNVVAHSMGAIPAYNAWHSIPIHRRGRFISIEGNMTGEDCALASRKLAQGPDAVAEFIADCAVDTDPAMRRWGTDLASCDPEFLASFAAQAVAWCDNPQNEQHWKWAKGTVYLYGERSGFPAHHRDRFEELGIIEQAIEHSGHFPMHDNPDDLWNIVADAVRSRRRPLYRDR